MRNDSRVLVGLLAIAAACAGDLPSSVPLGIGPKPGTNDFALGVEAILVPSSPEGDANADAGVAATPPEPEAPPAPEVVAETGGGAVPDAGATTPDASVAIGYAGLYIGTDVSVNRMQGKRDWTEKDPNARTRVDSKPNGMLTITIVDSASGSDWCSVEAKPVGHEATIVAGQSCFGSGPVETGTIKSGKATFEGKRLVLDAVAEIEMTLGPQMKIRRTLEYHFEGVRP